MTYKYECVYFSKFRALLSSIQLKQIPKLTTKLILIINKYLVSILTDNKKKSIKYLTLF